MKYYGKRILMGIMMALCALCLVLAGCGGSGIKFEFETNGGDPIEACTVEEGTTFTLPIPTRGEEFSFEGWYDNAEFNGDPITEIVAAESKKFYAKWEQLYEIKLNLDGGTLTAGKIYAKTGSSIYEAVEGLVPEKEGWQFGEWLLNGTGLSHAAQVGEEAVELTARYKVGYIVKIHEQNLSDPTNYEDSNYTLAAEDYVGYAYLTDSAYTPVFEHTGFSLSAETHAGELRTKKLTETMSENVFHFYFDREKQTVMYFSNYPNGQSDRTTKEFYYGTEVSFPNSLYSVDGYFLRGWTVECGGEREFVRSHYIDSLVINSSEDVKQDQFTVSGEMSIHAEWSAAYTDMLRGADRIYHFSEEEEICYLDRNGKYFSGEYREGDVLFFDSYNDIKMEARLKGDGTFIYAQTSRDGITASYYTVENGMDTNIQITLNSYDGLLYKDGNSISDGTYTIDSDRNYHVSFTNGTMQGQEIVMRLLRSTMSDGTTQTLFQIRNEEEYEMEPLQHGLVAVQSGDNTLTYYVNDYLAIDLDGYGTASMNNGSSTSTYYYTYERMQDGKGDLLTLINSNGSSIYGICRVITVNGTLCYIPYEEELDATFTAADGSTLRLDGISEAVWQPKNGNAISGRFTVGSTAFGDYVVSLVVGGRQSVFLTTTLTTQDADGKEVVTARTVESRPEGYAEYSFMDDEYVYNAPLLVLNDRDGVEHSATIYGATEQNVLKPVAVGTYQYNDKERTYAFTAGDPIEYPADVVTSPVNMEGLKAVVFGLGSIRTNSGTRAVTFWISTTTESETDNTTSYTGTLDIGGKQKKVTISLVSGFAIVKIPGEEEGQDEWRLGPYSTDSSHVTTVSIALTDEEDDPGEFYVELVNGEEGENTFTQLTGLLGSARERMADGSVSRRVTFEFDGKGNGTLVTAQSGEEEETRVTGTIERVTGAEVENVEGVVYEFKPNGEEAGKFRFIMLIDNSTGYSYFTRETIGFSGTYSEDGGKGGTLELDGYGFNGVYTPAEGDAIEGLYSIAKDEGDEKIVCITTDNAAYYFDIKEGSKFEIRGSEYGTYLFVINYSSDNGYILSLDGHGNAVLKEDGASKSYQGTYTSENGVISVTITFETPVTGIPATFAGSVGIMTISYADTDETEEYFAFFVEKTDLAKVYVDRENWTVLTVDTIGNAMRYSDYGVVEQGHCVFITDDLVYFVTSDGEDACIYRYNATKGEIELLEYNSTQSYFTQNLDALLFSQYGFMIFNNQTLYYYTVEEAADGKEEVTLYRRAFGEAGVNEYGFLEIKIGKLEDTLELGKFDSEGFGGEIYYRAEGGITLHRAETDKKGDGTYKYPVRVSGTDENLYGLEDLIFVPTTSSSFRVTAMVTINGTPTQCTLYRNVAADGTVEMYLIINALRFDIEVTYQGKDNATYTITQLRSIATYESNIYMSAYVYVSVLFGTELDDTFGLISIVAEYDEDGKVKQDARYIDAEFGEDSPLSGYKLEHTPYEYVSGAYRVKLPPKDASDPAKQADTATYYAYFSLDYNKLYAQMGYRVAGYSVILVREDTPTVTGDNTADYSVAVERVISSEVSGASTGDYFMITLKQGEEEIKYELLGETEDRFYLIKYTLAEKEDETKEDTYTAATYYEVMFTEEDSSVDTGTVKVVKTATVTKIEADVYYTAGGSYAEILKGKEPEDAILHFFYANHYLVTACTYDADTKTYSVTAAGRTFDITITDEAAKTITITETTPTQP